jgi:hypothetical protein
LKLNCAKAMPTSRHKMKTFIILWYNYEEKYKGYTVEWKYNQRHFFLPLSRYNDRPNHTQNVVNESITAMEYRLPAFVLTPRFVYFTNFLLIFNKLIHTHTHYLHTLIFKKENTITTRKWLNQRR